MKIEGWFSEMTEVRSVGNRIAIAGWRVTGESVDYAVWRNSFVATAPNPVAICHQNRPACVDHALLGRIVAGSGLAIDGIRGGDSDHGAHCNGAPVRTAVVARTVGGTWRIAAMPVLGMSAGSEAGQS